MCISKRKEDKFLREWTMFELRIQRTYSEWLMIADDCESNATNIQSAFYRTEWVNEPSSERTKERSSVWERERMNGRNIDTESTNTNAKLNHRTSANDCVNTQWTNENAFNNLCEKLFRWLFHSLSLPPDGNFSSWYFQFTRNACTAHASYNIFIVFFSLLRSLHPCRLFCFRMRCTFECVISIVLFLYAIAAAVAVAGVVVIRAGTTIVYTFFPLGFSHVTQCLPDQSVLIYRRTMFNQFQFQIIYTN